MADKDQKTQDPTGKRLDDARKKGDIAMSPEMRHAIGFVAMLAVLGGIGVHAFARLARLLVLLWSNADDYRFVGDGAQGFATGLFTQIGLTFAPLFGMLMAFAVFSGLVQGRPAIVWSRVAPKWSKVSPVAGFKRLFSVRALVELSKTLAKCGVVIAVATWVLWPHAVGLDTLVGADPADVGAAAGGLVVTLVKAVAIPVAAIAGADLIYQRRSWLSKMRMTLQEVKDEHKESDGNPKIKAKIRQIAAQRSRRRMMAAVPTASVIITNPTHYAVALKYDHGKMGAPVVVAKGVDTMALKIREVATAAGVPIIENRPLARALHATVEIDRPVPPEHYAAVAEVISYVMKLAKRQR
ncbi:flagellar biosynthesis protein FlhB [Sphingomonas mollis]|uniref:Flagellar biosynthetic protein FlhB n=1 Tax=Sphingomonas mollis TaxID=2795726 RepID=A0ABS0XQJ4_9SPHN|nr:flagellar biosynthesis protein FlhB [Sphingomonas sp. BT553]